MQCSIAGDEKARAVGASPRATRVFSVIVEKPMLKANDVIAEKSGYRSKM